MPNGLVKTSAFPRFSLEFPNNVGGLRRGRVRIPAMDGTCVEEHDGRRWGRGNDRRASVRTGALTTDPSERPSDPAARRLAGDRGGATAFSARRLSIKDEVVRRAPGLEVLPCLRPPSSAGRMTACPAWTRWRPTAPQSSHRSRRTRRFSTRHFGASCSTRAPTSRASAASSLPSARGSGSPRFPPASRRRPRLNSPLTWPLRKGIPRTTISSGTSTASGSGWTCRPLMPPDR